jgi:hypothetical protein
MVIGMENWGTRKTPRKGARYIKCPVGKVCLRV